MGKILYDTRILWRGELECVLLEGSLGVGIGMSPPLLYFRGN
jgi:hypothetical protein